MATTTTQAQTVENDILPFADMVENLLAMGYENRAPSPETLRTDAAIVAQERCAACGCELAYVAFTRRKPHSYRAFAWCVVCDAAHEF